MNLKLFRLFQKWRRKRAIKKICKANNFNCSECIHHEHIFEGAVFRGTRCRLEDGSSQFKRMAVQLGYEPVVRCRECKHHVTGYCRRDINGRTNMFRMFDNDFCSYGERRTDE